MAVVWYAIGIYMVGVAYMLYVRPSIMFRENGMWKEFGLNTQQDSQTIFPFWMFAVVWAILSYAFASMVSMFFAAITLKSVLGDTTTAATAATAATVAATTAPNASFMQPISQHPAINMPTPSALLQLQPQQTQQQPKVPGYYILDPYANPAQPRYIYYGTEPPGTFTPQ
jgi:hypothetical protein